MSAIPLIQQPVSRKTEVLKKPVVRSRQAKPVAKVGARAKAKAHAAIRVRVAAFSVVAFAVFVASSMLGSVALETSRRESISAHKRILEMRSKQSSLEAQLAAVSSAEPGRDWIRVVDLNAAEPQKESRVHVAFNP